MTTARKASTADVYEIVTDQVLAALEAGVVPWHQPWASSVSGMPVSLSSRKPYRGLNVFILGLTARGNGYNSPWWGTYNQIRAQHGQVRRGETGTVVVLWKPFIKDEQDPRTGQIKSVTRFMLRYFKVFNADQADWEDGKAPKYVSTLTTEHDQIAAAEAIVAGYPKAPRIWGYGSQAFYRASGDTITVPPRDNHESSEGYYSTLFHEMGHSTGHASRLARKGVVDFDHFGSGRYAEEELVAEMTAAFLCGAANMDTTKTLPNSAAYLANWLKALRDDRRMLVTAAGKAQHAADHILGTDSKGDDES